MLNVLIIGGGLAGLTAAVHLSEKNVKVKLIESTPKLGGRTYSLRNEKFDDIYDNGQHIMMGCYDETLELLKKIGAGSQIEFPESLFATFVNRDGLQFELSATKSFYPVSLAKALLKFEAISFKSRLKIIDFFIDLYFSFTEDLKGLTVADWLKSKNQPEEAVKNFWEILAIGTLNTKISDASAVVFSRVLNRVFFDDAKAASIVIPKVGLSELFSENSKKFIEQNGGSISCSERVTRFDIEKGKVKTVFSSKQSYKDFDFVVSAVPAYNLDKIVFDQSDELFLHTKSSFFLPSSYYNSFQNSPILNIHLWIKENPFKKRFYGLLNSKYHWLFNHGKHVSITVSAADELLNLSNNQILDDLYSDLEIFFPIFDRQLVTDFKIIKEKRATFVPDVSSNILREKIYSPFENLILAGDWMNNGLPATIESAVLSGRLAAEKILFH